MKDNGRLVVEVGDPKLLVKVLNRLKERSVPKTFNSPLAKEIILSDKLLIGREEGLLVLVDDENFEGRVELVKLLIKGKLAYEDLSVGIDPGNPHIIAVVGEGEVIDVYRVKSVRGVVEKIEKIYKTYPYKTLTIKVGGGSGSEEVIAELTSKMSKMENVKLQVVDEKYTSREVSKPSLKVKKRYYAAVNIALKSGVEVEVDGGR